MKIVITGSLGRIRKPLVQELIRNGHIVTVISSNPAKRKDIEALHALAAIGTIEDVDFLTNTFIDADTVYCMLPPFEFKNNPSFDYKTYSAKIASIYATAIRRSGVKRVVHLSSIGAHMDKGNGLLVFHNIVENVLKELSPSVAITHMRPVGFYYNLYDFLDPIKGKGFMASLIGKILTIRFYGLIGFLQGKRGLIMSNYGGRDTMPWVSPQDIALAIADEIVTHSEGIKVRYVASDILSCQQIATAIGIAIDKPYLKWETISDKQMLSSLIQFKLPESLAADITEMNSSMHTGILFEDYYNHQPVLGKVKIKDFAKEFADRYNAK